MEASSGSSSLCGTSTSTSCKKFSVANLNMQKYSLSTQKTVEQIKQITSFFEYIHNLDNDLTLLVANWKWAMHDEDHEGADGNDDAFHVVHDYT